MHHPPGSNKNSDLWGCSGTAAVLVPSRICPATVSSQNIPKFQSSAPKNPSTWVGIDVPTFGDLYKTSPNQSRWFFRSPRGEVKHWDIETNLGSVQFQDKPKHDGGITKRGCLQVFFGLEFEATHEREKNSDKNTSCEFQVPIQWFIA